MGGRPTKALINLEAIKSNFASLRSRLSGKTVVMSVVKANAYGHGDIEVAKCLESAGCSHFGVAMTEEAIRLRDSGIEGRIYILGGTYPGQAEEIIQHDLTPLVFNIETISILNDAAIKANKELQVHIKVDTGMGRLGVLPANIAAFLNSLKELKGIKVTSMCSHFAESENPGSGFNTEQIDTFTSSVEVACGEGFDNLSTHMANSAAIIDLPEAHFDMVRPGLMLYGAYPVQRYIDSIELTPAMSLSSQILQLKKVPKDFTVSYGRKFKTKRESIIATVPIGYGDGLPRSLSNQGEAIVGGRRVPIAGTICMDLTMLDVTDVEGVNSGDDVTFIGKMGKEEVTIEEVAKLAGTIPYEIMCGITSRVPRIYVP